MLRCGKAEKEATSVKHFSSRLLSPESQAPEGAERVEESGEENPASPEQREPASRFPARERVNPAPDGMATRTQAEDSKSHRTGGQIQCPKCHHPKGHTPSGCRTLWGPVWEQYVALQASCPQSMPRP